MLHYNVTKFKVALYYYSIFVQMYIKDSGCSVHRRTKILVTIGPTAIKSQLLVFYIFSQRVQVKIKCFFFFISWQIGTFQTVYLPQIKRDKKEIKAIITVLLKLTAIKMWPYCYKIIRGWLDRMTKQKSVPKGAQR